MQEEIIQSIFGIIINGVDPDWKSIEFNYKADDSSSEYFGLFKSDNTAEGYFDPGKLSRPEKSELSELMRKLQKEVGEGSEDQFTHCVLFFEPDGNFKMNLSYEPIDWSVQAQD